MKRAMAWVVALCVGFVAPVVVRAQESGESKPAPVSQPSAKVPTSELELLIKPLTKAELVVEADAWQAALQAKVRELSQTQIAITKTTGDERGQLLQQEATLREERTQIIDRLNVVLAALKERGGKIEDYQQYAAAVGGVGKVADAGVAWALVTNWVKSPEGGIRYGRNIILFLVALLVFKIIASVLGAVTERAMRTFGKTSHLLREFVANAVRKITMFVGFVVALSMLEVNIGPFLAAMGAAGFIIGFALQGTLSNFAAGVMILLYRPYDLGDMVTVAGATGKVTAMTLVSTLLINADGHAVTIPNSSIWGGTITNLSAGTVTTGRA